jgi:hypothetical protein
VLGNGPSLARIDLGLIEHEFSFGTNRIYLLFGKTSFRPTYFVCMNELVIRQEREAVAGLKIPRFLNWSMRDLFAEDATIMFLRESFKAAFSKNPATGIWVGSTVTFAALQLAFYMGFQQVILIGVDHRYSTPGPPHVTVTAAGPDHDHFDPGYFSNGFRWQLPDLVTSEYAYRLAHDAFKADGREVLDATEEGDLMVFPKVKFQDVAG